MFGGSPESRILARLLGGPEKSECSNGNQKNVADRNHDQNVIWYREDCEKCPTDDWNSGEFTSQYVGNRKNRRLRHEKPAEGDDGTGYGYFPVVFQCKRRECKHRYEPSRRQPKRRSKSRRQDHIRRRTNSGKLRDRFRPQDRRGSVGDHRPPITEKSYRI